MKGKKGLQKTRPREGKWKNKEEAKGREGVVARMKEAPTRSLREGKEGKEAKKQCCRNGTGDKKYETTVGGEEQKGVGSSRGKD